MENAYFVGVREEAESSIAVLVLGTEAEGVEASAEYDCIDGG